MSILNLAKVLLKLQTGPMHNDVGASGFILVFLTKVPDEALAGGKQLRSRLGMSLVSRPIGQHGDSRRSGRVRASRAIAVLSKQRCLGKRQKREYGNSERGRSWIRGSGESSMNWEVGNREADELSRHSVKRTAGVRCCRRGRVRE